ncbi:multicopper oxidase domain-containing protein [Noviherbaspirillum sp. 1P10PC]|uniref:multicopper oxidase family protein n=1 Tax=Noviherbaspirillum sp. 1P10PC TaxID=3132292 RepID=UPI0039A1C531
MDRRTFLKAGSLFSVGAAAGMFVPMQKAWAFTQSMPLAKFVQPLRRFGVEIPFATPDGKGFGGATHYTVTMEEISDVLHLAMPSGTRLWAYTNGAVKRHLGAGIVAHRDEKVQVTFINKLPDRHLLPVDTTLPGAEMRPNRTAVHLHGGKVPWTSDGGPHFWWTPASEGDRAATRGDSFVDMGPALTGKPSADGSAEMFYPNEQSARMMWYHDHALAITRLNVYAGLAAPYVITDDDEAALAADHNLPGPLDPRTIYLTFQDKVFAPASTAGSAPASSSAEPDGGQGDLWYPDSYEATLSTPSTNGLGLPHPSVVPEMFGDTMLVNGTVYPFLDVEQRQYRLRMLNACNARFLNPRLVHAQSDKATEANRNVAGPGFVQIGNECGFLPAPTLVGDARGLPLLLAPAERADLIVDFSAVPAGSTLILYNDAPAPFPGGDSKNDYFPQNPKTPMSAAGFGPDTRTLLQIRVKAHNGAADLPVTLPATLGPGARERERLIAAQVAGVPTPAPPGVHVRHLTLNEAFDEFGRLIQFLGTDEPVSIAGKEAQFGQPYDAAPTEIINAGTTEVWEIANLTADTHPIHFHLVNVQVLSRQRFSDKTYPKGQNIPFAGFAAIRYLGKPMAPDPNELGWKETVRMNPGEVTRVAMRFDLPVVAFPVPASPRTGGNEYVWHCHILEHEEHDMMRPLIVL